MYGQRPGLEVHVLPLERQDLMRVIGTRLASRLRDHLSLATDDVGHLQDLDPQDRYRSPIYDLHSHSNKPEDWVEPDWWIPKRPKPRP